MDGNLLTINKAADLTEMPKNSIIYLIKYDRINQYDNEGNIIDDRLDVIKDARVSKNELLEYLEDRKKNIKKMRKNHIGEYDERLAFDGLRERKRTKHVHRLHPYKGKFIPQLVEFFLDESFKKGNTILDPFMGSGTTLVQANEMGINAIGIDVSPFNCMISEVKTDDYKINLLESEINNVVKKIKNFSDVTFNNYFQEKLKNLISEFNHEYMPELKRRCDSTNELKKETEREFDDWLEENGIDIEKYNRNQYQKFLTEDNFDEFDFENILNKLEADSKYLNKWFAERSLKELLYFKSIIPNYNYQNVLKIILSRSARSVRLVPHFDLTNPKEPVNEPYFCYKHKKICTPVKKAIGKIKRYSYDTLRRIKKYSKERDGETSSKIIPGDGRNVDIGKEIKIKENTIDGIFTSPPYIGNINYHEQHKYAYELLDIERYDEKEIGPKFRGRNKEAKNKYVEGISEVLTNVEKYMKEKAIVFIVANDKYNLYPKISENAGMQILKEYKRPVSKRAERDRKPYSEKIFKMSYL